jgi:hypothetical protein
MVTVFHDTTASRAARIVACGFRQGVDGTVYFAEDFATAEYFAREMYCGNSAAGATETVLKVTMPASMARLLERGAIGAARNTVFVVVGTGFELMLSREFLPASNAGMRDGMIGVTRLRMLPR